MSPLAEPEPYLTEKEVFMSTAVVEEEELRVVIESQPVEVVQVESAIQRSAELSGWKWVNKGQAGEEEGRRDKPGV